MGCSEEEVKNVKILFTDSMKKFDVSPGKLDLDVIRLCTFSPLYLNKQIINLLWHGGVKKEIFIDLQEEQVESLLSAFEGTKENSKTERLIHQLLNSNTKGIEKGLDPITYKLIKQDPLVSTIIKTISYQQF